MAPDTVVSVDELGRLTLPKAVCERLRLQKDSRLNLSVAGGHIELRPLPDVSGDEGAVTLVRKGKILVLDGITEPVDAVALIKADREERDEKIARLVKCGRQ